MYKPLYNIHCGSTTTLLENIKKQNNTCSFYIWEFDNISVKPEAGLQPNDLRI